MKSYFYSLLMLISLTSCSEDIIPKPNAKDFFHVEFANAQLPVKIRGNTASNKIALFIPGGPGGTGLDVSELDPGNWKELLEQDIAIAYYDQRGIGNAQGDFTEASITLDQYVADIHAIVRVLKVRYPRSEIYLMGHSFGAMLIYRYIKNYGKEELVSKYIAASGIGTRIKDDEHWIIRRTYVENIARQKVAADPTDSYWKDVLLWLNQHSVIDNIELRAQLFQYMQQTQIEEEIKVSIKDVFNILLFSENNFFPYYLTLLKRQPFINRLVDEERQWDIKADIPKIDQPILLIGGEYDISAPPQELTWIYNNIQSEEKQLTILPDAGHDLFISQPKLFASSILDWLK